MNNLEKYEFEKDKNERRDNVKNRWSLCVKNFGKIESAEIEVSPLMIFIGDNNSGKSYLMSLLWGLINGGSILVNDKNAYQLESYKLCCEWYKSLNIEENIIIDKTSQQLLVNWFNEILDMNKVKIIKSIFNKNIPIEEICIKYKYVEDICIDKSDLDLDKNHGYVGMDNTEMIWYSLSRICYFLVIEPYKSWEYKNIQEPIFLPASRTGFALTYKTLLDNLMDTGFSSGFEKKTSQSTFTMPIISFLRNWLKLDKEKSIEFKSIVSFIEREIIKGNIAKDNAPVENISYIPENSKEELPLYLTSSLVTETTPLVLFLTYLKEYRTLIIEEPEAHLHLKAQIAMARVVVRLVNSGLNVWLTTHSDTFMQQINNLLKLNVHKDKAELLKKLNLEKQDCLDISNVKVYEFNTSEGKTTVTAIKNSETGFPLPTFNDVISKLTDEVMILEDEEDD